MPIQVNLLSEALAEEDLRRRDPVKRAIYVGIVLVALSLVWYSSVWLEQVVANSQLSQVQASIQSHTNDYNVVVENLKKINDAQTHLEALQKLSNSRLLQGNLLNALQQLYVPNTRLMRFKIEQSYTVKKGQPVGRDKKPGPTKIIGHTVLTLDLKDTSPNPGDGVNKYKDALAHQSYFKSNLDTNNAVRLFNLSSPQTGADGQSFVLFTLECHYPDQIR